MPSQARRHNRNVRNQSVHLSNKANRLARKVEARFDPSMLLPGNVIETERQILAGMHGDWCKMVLTAAQAVSAKGEAAWCRIVNT
jgi:hypothetical protein